MRVTDAVLLITDAGSDSPPVANIWAVLIVWRIIRTVLCCIVYHFVLSHKHT